MRKLDNRNKYIGIISRIFLSLLLCMPTLKNCIARLKIYTKKLFLIQFLRIGVIEQEYLVELTFPTLFCR